MFSWRTLKSPQKSHWISEVSSALVHQSRLVPKSLEENVGFCTNLVEFPIQLTCFAASCKKCLCKIKGWSLRFLCLVLVKILSTENAEERWGLTLCPKQCYRETCNTHSLWWHRCAAEVSCVKNRCLSKLLVLFAETTVVRRQRQQINKIPIPLPQPGGFFGLCIISHVVSFHSILL